LGARRRAEVVGDRSGEERMATGGGTKIDSGVVFRDVGGSLAPFFHRGSQNDSTKK